VSVGILLIIIKKKGIIKKKKKILQYKKKKKKNGYKICSLSQLFTIYDTLTLHSSPIL